MPRPGRPSPAALCKDDWPNPKKRQPWAAHVAAHISRTLTATMTEHGMSLRAIEAATDVDHDTVNRIIHGQVWPDIWTVAKLEDGLQISLWLPRPARGRR